MTQPDGKPERPLTRPKRTRWQRIAAMDNDILDVEGAATLLGVSASTIYHLAQQGKIPATRIGREWRFAWQNLVQWVVNGSEADQITAALAKGRAGRPRR